MTNNDKIVVNASSKVLINCIATYKLLNHNKVLAIKCMEELDRRRQSGEDLNYEDLIEEKLKEWQAKIPKTMSLSSPEDLASILSKKNG